MNANPKTNYDIDDIAIQKLSKVINELKKYAQRANDHFGEVTKRRDAPKKMIYHVFLGMIKWKRRLFLREQDLGYLKQMKISMDKDELKKYSKKIIIMLLIKDSIYTETKHGIFSIFSKSKSEIKVDDAKLQENIRSAEPQLTYKEVQDYIDPVINEEYQLNEYAEIQYKRYKNTPSHPTEHKNTPSHPTEHNNALNLEEIDINLKGGNTKPLNSKPSKSQNQVRKLKAVNTKPKPLNSKPSKSQNQVRKLKAVNTKPKPLNSKPSLKSQQEKKQKKHMKKH